MLSQLLFYSPIPVAARSKSLVCGGTLAGILGYNLARGMDVCLLSVVSFQVKGLCNGLISRPGESYRVRCG
jgi:hypothetical protein